MMKQFYRRASACCLALLLTACSSTNNDPDRDPSVPPPPEGVKVEIIQDKQIHVLAPIVEFDSGVMNITGYVRRKPGVRGVITGRVDIQVVDPDGTELDWIPALVVPSSIPTEGRGEAGYVIHYGWIPPAGSIIKVSFVDSKTAALEDSADGDTVGGTYGSHTGGGGSAGHGGGHHGGMGMGH
jgi:hypothetical protein